jgi:hypothetical protein
MVYKKHNIEKEVSKDGANIIIYREMGKRRFIEIFGKFSQINIKRYLLRYYYITRTPSATQFFYQYFFMHQILNIS